MSSWPMLDSVELPETFFSNKSVNLRWRSPASPRHMSLAASPLSGGARPTSVEVCYFGPRIGVAFIRLCLSSGGERVLFWAAALIKTVCASQVCWQNNRSTRKLLGGESAVVLSVISYTA
jgi:hypothetical protein